MTYRVTIPSSLQNGNFRFVKIPAGEKFPFEKEWQKKKNYTWDDPELQNHLNGGGNYGVVGGYGGLVVIDADKREVEEAVRESLPETFTVRTGGGGLHFYFIAPDLNKPIRLREKKAGDLGDVQYTGKQVVGANSLHPNGNRYEVKQNLPIQEVSAEEIRLALRDFLMDKSKDVVEEEREALERSGIGGKIPIDKVVPLNNLKQVGKEFQGGHPIHGSTTGHNFCVNPSKGVWHCFRHGSGGGSLSWLAVQEGVIDCSEAVPGALRGGKFKRVLEKAEERGLIDKGERVGVPYHEKGKFVPKYLAEEIMADFHFITLKDTDEIYIYDGGVFLPEGETTIREETQRRLGKYSRRHYQIEVVNFIRSATYTSRDRLNENSFKIVVENGILNLKTLELEPHNPNPPSTIKIPVGYDPDAKCPKIKKFLEDILHHDDIPVIQEGIGYCLLKGYPISAAFMLIGSGANGKSTLLNLITRFLGEENVSTPSLQDLLQNRFAKAKLYGKLANAHADIPSKKLESTGAFKMLTGQDLIYAEKKYQSAFTYRNHAKLWFSCNELPYTSDRTPAFFERWILIDFPNRFPRDDPRTDPHMIEKITTKEELSGLLNWVLEGLHNLLDRGYFEKSKSREEVEGEWILQTDSLRAFVRFSCKQDPSSVIVKSDFYNAYLDFCTDRDLPAAQPNTVGRRLPSIAPYVRSTRPKIRGRREHCWEGITTGGVKRSVQDVQDKQNTLLQTDNGRSTDRVAYKKGTLNNVDILDTLDRGTVTALKGKIRDLLFGMPLKMGELLANLDKSEQDRVKKVVDKMAESGEILKDANDRWRLSYE